MYNLSNSRANVKYLDTSKVHRKKKGVRMHICKCTTVPTMKQNTSYTLVVPNHETTTTNQLKLYK